jgi:signal transduction histidine kinase
MNPNQRIKWRMTAFVLAIFVVFDAIVVTALTSWQRIGEMRRRLATVQKESFRIAEEFQKSILELNATLLRHALHPDPAQWQSFYTRSDALNAWLDEQFHQFGSQISPAESALLSKVDTAYDGYLNVATNLLAQTSKSPSKEELLAGLSGVREETDRLLDLGMQLAGAHRDTLTSSVAESNRSLANLRIVLLSALVLLLVFSAGLARIIFRDLIAPLRVKLVESAALLERQEKLASLGLLAAGVAHEIRNPLTAIKARLFTQQKLLTAGTPERADSEVIGQEINRLERIVKDVLRFARPSDPEFKIVPAAEPLQQVAGLLAEQFESTKVQLKVEDGPPALIRIDPHQIQQVLINLIQNAADSMGQNGTITLRVRLDNVRLGDQVGSAAVLEVSDTGSGIPAEVEKRLFDPFFTTKESGTGLGLPIASRMIEKNGGALRYQTQVGHGTTFGIILPRVTEHNS